jgi:hypothetical protein
MNWEDAQAYWAALEAEQDRAILAEPDQLVAADWELGWE